MLTRFSPWTPANSSSPSANCAFSVVNQCPKPGHLLLTSSHMVTLLWVLNWRPSQRTSVKRSNPLTSIVLPEDWQKRRPEWLLQLLGSSLMVSLRKKGLECERSLYKLCLMLINLLSVADQDYRTFLTFKMLSIPLPYLSIRFKYFYDQLPPCNCVAPWPNNANSRPDCC